jgi:hypothetical protein
MDAKLEHFPVDLNRAGFTKKPLLERASRGEIVIMDNLPVHKGAGLRRRLKR